MKKTSDSLPSVEYVTFPNFDEDGVQITSGIRPDGKEDPDPVPTAPPVGYTPPPDLMTMIRTMIKSEALLAELRKNELETFEEADDFDIPDDPIDVLTDYEKVFMPPQNPPGPPAASSSAVQKPVSQETKNQSTEVLDTSVLGDTNTAPKNEPKAPQKQD